MASVEARLRTFRGWTSPHVQPAHLAEAGFVYMGTDDAVQCHECEGLLRNWEPGDRCWDEHARHYPACLYVQTCFPDVIRRVQGVLENRRSTFRSSPLAGVDGDRLAAAGFFYVGPRSQVACHRCLVTVDDLRAEDNPWDFHNHLSPGCPYTLANSASTRERMADVTHRICSFTNWPQKVHVNDLVLAGFYYTGRADRVSCHVCGLVLEKWEPGDRPIEEHRRNSPRCALLRSLSGAANPLSVAFEKAMDQPTMAARLATFWSWPSSSRVDVTMLAAAGFVYTGLQDKVQCCWCQGSLASWEDGDHPWSEHFRHFPLCFHVLRNAPTSILSSKMRLLSERQESFARWRCAVAINTPAMAEAGLFSCGKDDYARCHACGVTLSQWEAGDEPWSEHRRHSPLCPFLKEGPRQLGRENDAAQGTQKNHASAFSTLEGMGFTSQQIKRALASFSASTDSPTLDDVVNVLLTSAEDGGEEENAERFRPTTTGLQETGERHLCKVCMDAELGILFQPCGHLACCVDCAPQLRRCPYCQSAIHNKVRAFLPWFVNGCAK